MRNTFDLVWDTWSWDKTWGWDFPITAMSAARLNMPEKAIDALFMDVVTNTHLKNGRQLPIRKIDVILAWKRRNFDHRGDDVCRLGWNDRKQPRFPKRRNLESAMGRF